MPAAAKPMGMIMDVTVSCARGEGRRVRRSAIVSIVCRAKHERRRRFAQPRTRLARSSRRRAVGALPPRGGFVPEPRAARARETYQRRAPEVDESLRSLDGLCVGAVGEVSARSRREARARGVRGGAFRVCTMPSLVSPRYLS